MGRSVEVTIRTEEGEVVLHLTERMLEVILLIARDGLSYKEVAVRLSNRIIRAREGVPPPHLSHHTVRRYAKDIRDLFELGHLKPIRAMHIIYQRHHDTLEEVA